MFVPIFIPRRPTVYKTVKKKRVEIMGATCKVRTYVTFQQTVVLNEKTLEAEHIKPHIYGFQVEVELNKEEYKNNRHCLEGYVCRKAKGQRDYQKILKDCLAQEPYARDYTIETYVPMDDIDAVDVHTAVYEHEVDVPVN